MASHRKHTATLSSLSSRQWAKVGMVVVGVLGFCISERLYSLLGYGKFAGDCGLIALKK